MKLAHVHASSNKKNGKNQQIDKPFVVVSVMDKMMENFHL